MDRTCKGYRDPVAALFRDESKGFGTKCQRVIGPKKSPTAASRKSSKEIDKALAACSTVFRTSSLSDSDPKGGDDLSFEPMAESSPSVEHEATCFHDTDYIMDEPRSLDDNFQFTLNIR